jgi:hypothetical protein
MKAYPQTLRNMPKRTDSGIPLSKFEAAYISMVDADVRRKVRLRKLGVFVNSLLRTPGS